MAKFDKKTGPKYGKKSSRKGVPNKVTKDMREAFQGLIEDNTDKMQGLLDRVAQHDPAKALEIIHKFSDFFLPKLTRTEYTDTTSIEYLMSLPEHEQEMLILEIRRKVENGKE